MADEAPAPPRKGDVDVDVAVGVLLAQGAVDLEDARRTLRRAAVRTDRSEEEMAGQILAGLSRHPGTAIELAEAYAEVGAAVGGAPDGDTLPFITELAVRRVPRADWASVTLLRAGRFETVAATDQRAQEADRLQYELGQGPCVDAVTEQTAYVTIDLGSDERWPEFSTRARSELGVNGILSFRLGIDVDDEVLACLNIYSLEPVAYDRDSAVLGTLLAAHASGALLASRWQHRVSQLERALETNRSIGMAMGILMHQQKVTADHAFALLRIASQHGNRKLYDVAVDVVETGTLTLPGS